MLTKVFFVILPLLQKFFFSQENFLQSVEFSSARMIFLASQNFRRLKQNFSLQNLVGYVDYAQCCKQDIFNLKYSLKDKINKSKRVYRGFVKSFYAFIKGKIIFHQNHKKKFLGHQQKTPAGNSFYLFLRTKLIVITAKQV